jgi:peptidoglycan hydrolase CwlO-like protein
VEHVERQDEREQEIKGDLDDLDEQAEQMDERTDKLQETIDERPEDDDSGH